MRPLGHTSGGIALLGVGGTIGFALLGAAMLNFRSVCEPVLRLALPYVAGRMGGYYRYDPSRYEFWAWMPIAFAMLWLLLSLIALMKKPGDDRRIDRAIRERLHRSARGAPLEPD